MQHEPSEFARQFSLDLVSHASRTGNYCRRNREFSGPEQGMLDELGIRELDRARMVGPDEQHFN